ncbi:3-oxoadipate enol-lactonase [Rhizobium rhizoryzae]|uniref:3-oxoadipate enol-lactonase n=1 Tax=Rhizobium rhizoryzae TaxID=451876 RepID=A0A7W6LJZ7_9HYPH|nr:3-oxoadipate enol-lactonase [Rhizobium rhizoryzae]MBB4145641.1 3-oxoadipate enol-lactonase [Rhizobium rhizoryzae]
MIFSNSLGTDLHMWDLQVAALSQDFRILRYDNRGHGRSSSPASPFKLAELGADLIALMDHLGIDRASFCGLSIGGLIGQWLAVHASNRFERFVLCATAPRIGSFESWQHRMDTVIHGGLNVIVEATRERWFTQQLCMQEPELVDRILASFSNTSIEGYVGCCAALRDADMTPSLGNIEHPVLAVSGQDDPVCRPSELDEIAKAVVNGRHFSLPGKHIVNLEGPGQFNRLITSFIKTDGRVEFPPK